MCENCNGECGEQGHEHGPMAVAFDHYVKTEPSAADYGAYSTTSFAGLASEQAIRILGNDPNRSRAVIQSDAAVWIGKKEQITNGNPSGWKQTATMQPLEIRNKQEVYVMHTGVAVNVTVLNERYEEP